MDPRPGDVLDREMRDAVLNAAGDVELALRICDTRLLTPETVIALMQDLVAATRRWERRRVVIETEAALKVAGDVWIGRTLSTAQTRADRSAAAARVAGTETPGRSP